MHLSRFSLSQESNFFYLTGCNVPASYVLLAFQPGAPKLESTPVAHLYIPKIQVADLMWSVPPPTVQQAQATHDATSISYTTELSKGIQDVLKAFPGALFHTLPTGSPLFPTLSSEYTSLTNADGAATVTDKYLLSALHQARLTKDKAEFELIAQANAISSRAHETVMRVLGQGVKHAIKKGKGAGVDRPLLPGEWLIEKEAEAEALFVASCRREGCVSRHPYCHDFALNTFTFCATQLVTPSVHADRSRCDPRVDAALLLQRQGVRVGSRAAARSYQRA